MSEAAQITQISDNVNQGYIAGRDLYLGDQYVVQETLFFEPDLEDVESPAWVTTPKARELARSLATHHLVILAGQDLDDKTNIARHLAWLLRQELPGAVRVREWYRSSDPQKIETSFHETETTVLLLPQVLPHHIGHRLNELTRLLQIRRNYAVITTDGSRADWGIRSSSSEECLWHEVSWETYYGRPFLADALLTELGSLNGHRPDWLPRELHSGSPLTAELTVEEVAARLKQPDRIRRFVQWLQTEEASPRTLLSQLDQLGGDRADIFRWYQQLTPADQIFALGLVLFDGLPDDQIFAAVEYLVDAAWRRTDPNLPLFDYRDLARLEAYFHLADSGEDGARIETPSRKKREAVLQAAWELQRRRLLAVVPAMTRLIKQLSPKAPSPPDKTDGKEQKAAAWRGQLAQVGPATDEKPKTSRRPARSRKKDAKADPAPDDAEEWRFTQGAERELFSSPRRVEQLQRSVIESLSQIGVLSFEGVEASFLELAAEGSVRVQTVVAKALAAWRGDGHHEKLFQVLRNWWQTGCRTTPPQILAQRTVEGVDPLAGIRATVAMAIGYALQYDPPNQLAPELQGLFQVVVMDHHPAVRQRVLELTLPLAAASHPQQLEALLRDRLVQDQEQMYAISFGIAMAFTLHPFGALRVLDNWHVMVRSQGAREAGDLRITPRDRLLAAVVMAYGYIRCDPSQALLSTEQVVAALRSILTTEAHPFVRAHALMAAGLQGLHDFELVAPLLIEVLTEIALPDRKNVVSVFVRAYLKQREELRGGDGEIETGGRIYQIWLRSPRPLTQIETSLYSWLRNGDHPVARQVAAQTFAAFTATELEQRERTLGVSQKQILAPAAPPIAVRVAAHPRRLRQLPVLGYVAVHLAAPRRRRTRALVRPVLAEMLEVERSRSRGTLPLLDRWRSSGDEEVQGLAHSAATAFRLYRWRWVLILTQIFCAILAMNLWDWRWSHQDPLPLDEAMVLQERKILPLRFALTRGASIVRPAPEKPEEPKKEEQQEDKPEEKPEEEKPPRIPADLSERLLWSSIRTLERKLGLLEPKEPEEPQGFLRAQEAPEVPEVQKLQELLKQELPPAVRAQIERRMLARLFAELLLEYLRDPKAFQEKLQQKEKNLERDLRAIDRAFPGARARILKLSSEASGLPLEDEQAEQVQEVSPSTRERREPAAPERLDRRRAPLPVQLERGPVEIEIPVDAPSVIERLRKKLTKKKPPQGEDHGHR